jgi:hypothetical protein
MLHHAIFIDNEDNQAIRREIGQQLRVELGIELELPAGLKGKLDELCWLEGQSSSIVPEAEQELENKPSTNASRAEKSRLIPRRPEDSIPKLLADGPATGDSDLEYEVIGLHHRYYGLAARP